VRVPARYVEAYGLEPQIRLDELGEAPQLEGEIVVAINCTAAVVRLLPPVVAPLQCSCSRRREDGNQTDGPKYRKQIPMLFQKVSSLGYAIPARASEPTEEVWGVLM